MKAGRGRRARVQSQVHYGRITDTMALFLRMHKLSFEPKTAKPTTEVLRLCSRSQEKLSRTFLFVLPYWGRKIVFLQKNCITNRRILSTGSEHNFLPSHTRALLYVSWNPGIVS